MDRALKDPNLSELTESARRLGLDPDPVQARQPGRVLLASGYISVQKRPGQKKQHLIGEIAKTLSVVRGEKVALSATEKNQKKSTQKQKR